MNLEVANKVLDILLGRVSLMQDREEQEKAVLSALSRVCSEWEKAGLSKEVTTLTTQEGKAAFVREFLSYGLIEELLRDPNTEDVMINSLKHIFVHNSKKGVMKTDKRFSSWAELDFFTKKLALFSGKERLERINDLDLPDIGGRANVVLSPFGPQITITKTRQRPFSIIDLIEMGTLSYELGGQLWLYVEGLGVRPANVIVSGGVGSGKTTLLNALFSFIPMNDRIVVIEDTLELNTKTEENCSRLESSREVSPQELVKNSLRMRPDRIIVGEVRGVEARDMMTAMNIGKACMGTIHATTTREVFMRLESVPMNVPVELLALIDVVIIMKRFHIKKDIFRVVGEVAETAGLELKKILLAEVWGYDLKRRMVYQKSPSNVYRDRLAAVAGVSPGEVMEEIEVRSELLRTLRDKGIYAIEDISKFCRSYYTDPESALRELGCRRKDLLAKEKPSGENSSF